MRRNKLIIAILFVILIGLLAVVAGQLFFTENLNEGSQNILVLAIDESETRPGLGAVDMAFLVHLENGTIKNYTPVFPHGMTHPTVQEPPEYQAAGAGQMLLLHDCFYWEDSQQDLKYAKEIVEYQSNGTVHVDAVVGVTTAAVDAVIQAANPLEVNGEVYQVNGIDLIREHDSLYGGELDRGEAVKLLAKALSKAAKNPDKKSKMISAAMDQYSKGNIVVYPAVAFVKLVAIKGMDSIV